VSIDYRIVPGSFPNPGVSVGVCYTAVGAAAGGLTTGWWAVVLECFSSHPLVFNMQVRTVMHGLGEGGGFGFGLGLT